jgi:hypothetical protein
MKADKSRRLNILQTLETSLPKARLQMTEAQVEQLRNIAEVILGMTAVVGVASLAVIAPNALQLINKAKWVKNTFKGYGTKRRDQKRKIARAFYYLRQQNYVEIIPHGDVFLVKITRYGKKKVAEMELRGLKLNKQPKWDGNWWLVLADIPVKYRSQINSFRSKIKDLGMRTLQKSVWIYPFDPSDEISFLAKYYGLERFITIIEAKTLEKEDEKNLKSHFKKTTVI